MPQSSNVLSFVPVPNLEPGQRRSSAPPPKAAGIEDEAVLRKIAEAALSATGAEGAALALRRDGAVVCVARAGEMAPPLGARLDDTSGMSGECLRAGQTLRCDDTETDTRVDRAACRELGIRSVVAVPMRTPPGFNTASERPWMITPSCAVISAKSPWAQTPTMRLPSLCAYSISHPT